MKIKRYNKKSDISYAFGAFSVLSLIQKRENFVLKLLVKKEGLKSREVQRVLQVAEEKKIPFEINSRLIEKISYKENTYIVGVLKKYSCSLEKTKPHIVLVNPTNPGNIGTIIRCMVAFNFNNLAVIKPATDIFYPKVIRASMGAFFQINLSAFESFEDYINSFPKHKAYLFMTDGVLSLKDFSKKKNRGENIALVFGNESLGLKENLKKYGQSIYIPQSKNMESLNLSVSVGITLYSLHKDNVDKNMDK